MVNITIKPQFTAVFTCSKSGSAVNLGIVYIVFIDLKLENRKPDVRHRLTPPSSARPCP